MLSKEEILQGIANLSNSPVACSWSDVRKGFYWAVFTGGVPSNATYYASKGVVDDYEKYGYNVCVEVNGDNTTYVPIDFCSKTYILPISEESFVNTVYSPSQE